jgi:ubiquinone/menaquinone biosynthesis C-methylase UbiE
VAREFDLDGVVPWGRTAAEYEDIFALGDVAAGARVLDCGGGPASFAAEWGDRGRRVVSLDPIHALPTHSVRARFEAARGAMLRGMQQAHARFVWSYYPTPESVVDLRERALARFLADRDVAPGARYVAGALPRLPFAAQSFDLVLCSHLLFLYSDELDTELHRRALREMLRVGREVRIYPLQDMEGRPSRHLEPVLESLRGIAEVELVPLAFEFQRGSTRMLRARQR